MGACGPVDRALDSRSDGLGFNSWCWPCVEVSGKLRLPHCFGPPSCNGYLVHIFKVGSIVAGCIGAHFARGKVKSVEHGVWTLNNYLYLPLLLFCSCTHDKASMEMLHHCKYFMGKQKALMLISSASFNQYAKLQTVQYLL